MIGLNLYNPGFVGSLSPAVAPITSISLGNVTVGSNTVIIPGMYTIRSYGCLTTAVPPYGSVGPTAWATDVVATISDYGGGMTSAGTRITLTAGTSYGGVSVDSNGLVDGKYSIPQSFTIGGITVELTPSYMGSGWGYISNAGDMFSLQTKVGQTLAASVTPSANTVIPEIVGSLTVGYGGSGLTGYGSVSGSFGSITTSWPPNVMQSFAYVPNFSSTQIALRPALYMGSGPTVHVTDAFTVNGSTNYIVKVDGKVVQATGYSGYIQIPSGDPFNLQTKVGQTLPFEIKVV